MLRVLCLDIEGGFGGSSRSLFESIKHLQQSDVHVEVWCRRQGPIQARYKKLGVKCEVWPDMPHISSLPRLSRNLYVFSRFFTFTWPRSRAFRRMLKKAAVDDFDVIHLNHEGLFLLAKWLRRQLRGRVSLAMHIRTHLPSTVFSRWQYRCISQTIDQCIFITENERDKVMCLTGTSTKGKVIYNIVSKPLAILEDQTIANLPEFKLVSCSNYAWSRGNDQLIDIALELKRRSKKNFKFIVAGNMQLMGNLPGLLGKIANSGGTLADYAEMRGVAHMFQFLGSVSDPFPIFEACDALVRPSRSSDPWGREVLEAMSHGLPVLSVGEYDTFVEHGVTGCLYREFDAVAFADDIVALSEKTDLRLEMGEAGRNRISLLCNGPKCAADLLQVWCGLSERA